MQIASAQQGPCDGTSAVGQNNQKSGDFAETIDHRQGQRGHRTGSHCLMCCLPFSTSAQVEKLNVYKSGRQVQKHLVGE